MKDAKIPQSQHERLVIVTITSTEFHASLHILQGREGRVSELVRTRHSVAEVGGEVEKGQHRRFAPHAARLDAVSHSEVIDGDNFTVGFRLSALGPFRLVLVGELSLLPRFAYDATMTVAACWELSLIHI